MSALLARGPDLDSSCAEWIEALDEFLVATGVDAGGHLLWLPIANGRSAVGVLWWCGWSDEFAAVVAASAAGTPRLRGSEGQSAKASVAGV